MTRTVSTPRASFRDNLSRLTAHQKPMRGAPLYSRLVNRPAGRVLAALAHVVGLTPNQVTAISGGFSLVAIVILAVAPVTVVGGIAAALLLCVGYAFDSADGQLARLRGGGSPQGEWFDHVVDCIKVGLLHSAVLISLHRGDAPAAALTLPLAFLLVANTFFFTYVLTELLSRLHGAPKSAGDAAPWWRALASVPTDYGVLCLAFLAWGWPPAFLWIYGALLVGTAAYLFLGLPKWFTAAGRLTP